MQAVVFHEYGTPDVLQYVTQPLPTPKSNEVLIKIHASTVTLGDCELRAFSFPPLLWLPLRLMFGVFKPKKKILGQEMAGTITAVGKDITNWQVGDKVFAPTQMTFGAHAEYVALPVKYCMAPLPSTMTFAEAATLPTGGLNALHFMKAAKIQQGEKVLVIGAGGSIGTYAVQLAKHYGAEVTAVDRGDKLEMLENIGADHTINYITEDYTQNRAAYDVVFDVVCKGRLSHCVRMLRPKGRYLAGNLTLSRILAAKLVRFRTKKVIASVATYTQSDIEELKRLAEEGVLKAVIDKHYALSDMVAAHKYVERNEKKGNIVINNMEL